ncbi:DUF559 domain-containing protein [Candidatus Pacearchaeota archaeon]|nr:DUF559 domain-containing protein [Candidatus Pacearchaeota archaeon]
MGKIPPNVQDVIDSAAARAGEITASNMVDYPYTWGESPIEQLFLCALRFGAIAGEVSLDKYVLRNEVEFIDGLEIKPQHEIIISPLLKFRVDFLITFSQLEVGGFSSKSIVVELDGHKWHERNEEDRREEKMRERLIQRQGFHIYRFTGKEVTDNPFMCAEAVFSHFDIFYPFESEWPEPFCQER